MPLSRYLKIYPEPDAPGTFLLYSTQKGSLIRLSAAMLAAAENGTLSDNDQQTLERLAILVADPAEERAALAGLVERTNARRSLFRATIVLTLDCNLACPYCFEDRFRGKHNMSAETAHMLSEWVGREQIALGKDVEFRFYGGEPLMATRRLKEIARSMQDAAAKQGVKFSCTMVTNGTLLTRAIVEELLPLGLKSAQLTLDGPMSTHDQQRPFVSGKGSYAAIMANIKETWDLITLNLGGNFSQENYLEFPRMLDDLLAAGITPDMIGPLQFAPILPKSGRTVGHEVNVNCPTSSEPWVAEAGNFLREETLKRGFKALKPTMGICMIELENELVVNYDGSLYKCPALMGWPELSVGTLETGINDYSISHNLACWHKDECLECPYLPLCFGGCRLLTMLKNGEINDVECRKDFYDSNLEQIIRQDYHYDKLRLTY